jgi:hypothetical protein
VVLAPPLGELGVVVLRLILEVLHRPHLTLLVLVMEFQGWEEALGLLVFELAHWEDILVVPQRESYVVLRRKY